jgi:aspartyl-tRNA(Asn)/glutamyl-tRNA(Gln) amidotransferase subunit B
LSQRSKEHADDYRYMPDPDLPPIVIDEVYIAKIKAEMPVMPDEWRKRLSSLGVDRAQIETLLEGEVEDDAVSYLGNIEANLGTPELAKFLANWYVNVMIPLVREGKFKLGDDKHLELEEAIYNLVKSNKLSSTNAKQLFTDVALAGTLPSDLEEYATDKSYIQVSDEGEIAKIVEQVLSENVKAAEDVKNGEMKAIGFLVGLVMKQSQGKANPQMAQELIRKQLGL